MLERVCAHGTIILKWILGKWHLRMLTGLNRHKLGSIFVRLLWSQWRIFDFLTKRDRENKEVSSSPKSCHLVSTYSVCCRWRGDDVGVQQLGTTLCWFIVSVVTVGRVSVTGLSETRTVFMTSQNGGHVVQNWNCLMENINCLISFRINAIILKILAQRTSENVSRYIIKSGICNLSSLSVQYLCSEVLHTEPNQTQLHKIQLFLHRYLWLETVKSDLLPDVRVFCLMVRIFRLMLVLLCI